MAEKGFKFESNIMLNSTFRSLFTVHDHEFGELRYCRVKLASLESTRKMVNKVDYYEL